MNVQDKPLISTDRPAEVRWTYAQLNDHVQTYRTPLLDRIRELEERIKTAEQRESEVRVRIRARIDEMEPTFRGKEDDPEAYGFDIAKSEALEILDEEWEKP